jgi:hypothetical protein
MSLPIYLQTTCAGTAIASQLSLGESAREKQTFLFEFELASLSLLSLALFPSSFNFSNFILHLIHFQFSTNIALISFSLSYNQHGN